ncbi:molybdenum cofactor guanylyltransferase MobA [Zhongshania sp.]|jgi:molybdenum cofactor guanylyltransferase|uniref:molybdenum cofactor guanylyltransferase MobA n=1 Tax=Zhongshania sp. TaxID=1971902 RepID=UPI002A816C65|nr:molybdenum cofactor guanylyltransferase MobA [Zhongshania sp.]
MTAKKSTTQTNTVTALILAGGAGRRMNGQDKGLLLWQSKPLIAHIIDRLPKDVAQVLISCNRNIDHYQQYAVTVCDVLPDYQGPLAGLYAALQTISTHQTLILPCDSPTPPRDLLDRLSRELTKHQADICYAHDGERGQYLFALLNNELKTHLAGYLRSGERSVNQWYKQMNCVHADFSDQTSAFRNINQLSDFSPDEEI